MPCATMRSGWNSSVSTALACISHGATPPIGLHRTHIKVQISEDRNPEHGEQLAAFLPATLTLPAWLEAARKNPHPSVIRTEVFDEIGR